MDLSSRRENVAKLRHDYSSNIIVYKSTVDVFAIASTVISLLSPSQLCPAASLNHANDRQQPGVVSAEVPLLLLYTGTQLRVKQNHTGCASETARDREEIYKYLSIQNIHTHTQLRVLSTQHGLLKYSRSQANALQHTNTHTHTQNAQLRVLKGGELRRGVKTRFQLVTHHNVYLNEESILRWPT